MWKFPRIYCGDVYIKDMPITQYEHHDLTWGYDNAIDFGWGKHGITPAEFYASPYRILDTDVKVVALNWSGDSSTSYCVVEFEWTDGKYQVQFGHSQNFPPLWTIVKSGDGICYPGQTTYNPPMPHLHINIRVWQNFTWIPCDTLSLIWNNSEIQSNDPCQELEKQVQSLTKENADLKTRLDKILDLSQQIEETAKY